MSENKKEGETREEVRLGKTFKCILSSGSKRDFMVRIRDTYNEKRTSVKISTKRNTNGPYMVALLFFLFFIFLTVGEENDINEKMQVGFIYTQLLNELG